MKINLPEKNLLSLQINMIVVVAGGGLGPSVPVIRGRSTPLPGQPGVCTGWLPHQVCHVLPPTRV